MVDLIERHCFAFDIQPLTPFLIHLLANSVQVAEINQLKAVTFNFKDPDYSAERGGFHPVEIRLSYQDEQWRYDYLTDFAYRGHPYPELVKCFDVDWLHHEIKLYPDHPLNYDDAKSYGTLWLSNFLDYCQMQVFKLNVTLEFTDQERYLYEVNYV